jgi:hypothetical protein
MCENASICGQMINIETPLILNKQKIGPFDSKSLIRIDLRVNVGGTGNSQPTPWDLVNSFMNIQLTILGLAAERTYLPQVEADL